jgi:hypothetical protein
MADLRALLSDVAGRAADHRAGVADLVERCCPLARRFVGQMCAAEGVAVEDDVDRAVAAVTAAWRGGR